MYVYIYTYMCVYIIYALIVRLSLYTHIQLISMLVIILQK